MNKMEDKAYNLIEEIALNNHQWASEIRQPNSVGGKLEFDAIALLSAERDAMTQRFERLNVNSVSLNAPSPLCEICGSIDQL